MTDLFVTFHLLLRLCSASSHVPLFLENQCRRMHKPENRKRHSTILDSLMLIANVTYHGIFREQGRRKF
jgi:hypothetical protein